MPGGVERLVVELAEQVRSRFYGKYRGVVSDVSDPRQLGRIRARVPEVLGETPSHWALPCLPFAGDNQGQFTLPSVGSGVWLEFEAGDPARPVWSGCFYADGQLPKDCRGASPTPKVRSLRSETGLMVTLSDDDERIEVSDEDGSNLLRIEVQTGQVRLQAQTKVTVEAPQIELVDSATHPVVFGDELTQYLTQLVTALQTHTHPGQLAAGVLPVTPMVPGAVFPMPTPALLSTKVKAG